jgi:hypothetical protein
MGTIDSMGYNSRRREKEILDYQKGKTIEKGLGSKRKI